MFKRRLSKLGRAVLLVACLFFVSGLQQSCKDWLDDYKYDDSEPDWLGESIYAFLQEGSPNHTYRNYVELIDSLGEQETLGRTGSKTLFVADDAAFERFYANNAWGVKSIADMTAAQRKFLFYNAMLPDAILLDMMPNSGDNVDAMGNILSRSTEFSLADSITLLHSKYYGMYEKWPVYNKYWGFSDKPANFAMASSSMIHFFDEYLKRNSISETDIDFIFSKVEDEFKSNKKEYKKGDIYLYGNKLVVSDVESGNLSEDSLTIVCKNGYLYRIDDVLLPPMDMASELRVHKDTKIFSYLLDRFSFPVINQDVTNKYNEKEAKIEKDTVYSLRYLTASVVAGVAGSGMIVDPMNTANKVAAPTDGEFLKYDPATSPAERGDIYAMFATKDEFLYKYFVEDRSDNGSFLIKKFAPEVVFDPEFSDAALEKLLEALNAVPQTSIATILNNLMHTSFASSAPSKFDRLVNDANDVMGIEKQNIDECIVANNGVVYLLNKMFYPAKHSSVFGPLEIYENMSIMNRAIIANRYDYYLLAMDANYSLVIPNDANFVYYDPLTYDDVNGKKKMYLLHYDANRKKNETDASELWYDEFEVDAKTFNIIKTFEDQKTKGGTDPIFTDLLEYLVVVHDKSDPVIRPDRLYYATKGNGTIKIDASDPNCIKFYGGEQLEMGTVIVDSMQITKENGTTYCVIPAEKSTETLLQSSVPTPPTKSVYDNMLAKAKNKNDLYYEFFQLCNPDRKDFSDIIANVLDVSTMPNVDDNDTIKMYSIFYTDDANKTMKNCVPFFNTYHYTVYIPSNEAINELYGQGLPTWDLIKKESTKNPLRAMSMIRLVNGFARYHFQDQSVYHDRYNRPEATLSTSVINTKTGRFYDLAVKSADDNSTILVQDDWAKIGKDYDWAVVNNTDWAQVVNTTAEEENKTWNVMCRDIVKTNGGGGMATSSYSVLQPINRALLNSSMFGYDSRFKRFTETGEPVDTMHVVDGVGGDAGFGDEYYLVAKAGRVPLSTEDVSQPAELENVEIAFLMQPINEGDANWNSSICQEAFVYGKGAAPLMITRDGYLVNRTEVLVNKTTYYRYAYHTVTDANGEYIIKVNNAGEETARKLFRANESETPEAGGNDSDVE